MPEQLSRRVLIALALLFTLVWFANLDSRKLEHPDEGRYAEIAREMSVSGDWVTPRLNGLKYFEKPALQYWLTSATFDVFGVSEWTARLPVTLFAWLAIFALGCAGSLIAGATTGLYAALALAGCIWYAGIAHIVTLDALLTAWLAFALAAFLVAQRAQAPRQTRRFMYAAWVAIAAATLTKGLIGLVIPGGALVVYSLSTRDFAVWRRLHLWAGIAIVVLLCAPWFVIVSLRNPEFAPFFFVHEHFRRFLTTEHRRTGAWWYFVPFLLVGLVPWVGVFFWRLRWSWRRAPASNGFSWQRFCLAWIGFVLVFFSVSGSKLPSYILPLFPAAALLIGDQLARVSERSLRALLWLLAVTTTLVALIALPGYDWIGARVANERTPLSVYAMFGPWLKAGLWVMAAGGIAALVAARSSHRAGRTLAIASLAFTTLLALQLFLAGNDAFRVTRSAADLVTALQSSRNAPYDASAPFYQVRMYDQTLPFYLRRTTTVVAYRDELALGLDAEPEKGIADESGWRTIWMDLSQGYALMTPETYARLTADHVPMRMIARDPRRVLVART